MVDGDRESFTRLLAMSKAPDDLANNMERLITGTLDDSLCFCAAEQSYRDNLLTTDDNTVEA